MRLNITPFATTAMAIMPHTDPGAALELALSLDVPFWPQLPRSGFSEDMYVQSLAGFPGVRLDPVSSRLVFSKELFNQQAGRYLDKERGIRFTSPAHAAFLSRDLSGYESVRGQIMGPISCGFRLIDEEKRPVIYDDEVRPLLLNHLASEANAQLEELSAHNPQPFVFMDEPGLGMVFSGLSGYNETRARDDLLAILENIAGPAAIHLCGRPDWDFLLRLPIAVLSFNAFACGDLFVSQLDGIASFLEAGRVICWGIVPTHESALERFSVDELGERLVGLLQQLVDGGIDRGLLLTQSMLAPATCNLAGTPRSVEIAFEALRELSRVMKGAPLVPS